MVVAALKDAFAPLYILRLWGHCQMKRKDRFCDMPARGLAALCKYAGDDPAALEAALIEARFIARDGDDVLVLEWAEKNASLIAAWENGKLGGRPKKPTGNPAVTQQEPRANQAETDMELEMEVSTPLRSVEKPRKRGARTCPEDFEVTGAMVEWAAEKAPFADLLHETEKFKDWEFKDAKTDWPRAWRRWMRKASDDASKAPQARASPQSFRQQDADAAAAQMAAFGSLVAAKPSRPMEVIDVTPRCLDRQDLLEDGADLRRSVAAHVGRP